MSEHWKIDAHMYREELIYVHSIYNSNKISKPLNNISQTVITLETNSLQCGNPYISSNKCIKHREFNFCVFTDTKTHLRIKKNQSYLNIMI